MVVKVRKWWGLHIMCLKWQNCRSTADVCVTKILIMARPLHIGNSWPLFFKTQHYAGTYMLAFSLVSIFLTSEIFFFASTLANAWVNIFIVIYERWSSNSVLNRSCEVFESTLPAFKLKCLWLFFSLYAVLIILL